MTLRDPKFVVIGGGLGGALMAARLGRMDFDVEVYERRPDLRATDISAGKSINLAISVRGIHAIEQVDLAADVLAEAVPMRGRMMHAVDGELSFQPYGTQDSHYINSVSRGGLNAKLLDAAEACRNVRLMFKQQCTGVDIDEGVVELTNADTGEKTIVRDRIIIGADGAFSAVRGALRRHGRFNYSQDYLEHGYKELTIPARPDGSFAMEQNALHIWPRRSLMMIALPNFDGSYTVTLFWPFDGPGSFAAIDSDDDLRRVFDTQFPDAVPLMPTLARDYRDNPVGSMMTVRCAPWHVEDRVVLLGDACHAVVPFYGQGMNAAFEDCTVLSDCIAKHGPDFERVFAEYFEQRKEHSDAIADLAVANFLEMRDRVGDPAFLRKKAMESRLHRLFPNWYLPLYSMISFSRIPYADAVRRAARQDRIVRGVAWGAVVVATLLLALIAAWLLVM